MSTILIADDEARIRRLVSDFLKRDGHTIVEAADGKEALNILENRRPGLDMAILDVMMPGMDGFEVLRELREQEHGETHLPVMLLTARAEDADQVRGLEGGADDYVTKPFSLEEVVARIRAILRRTREQVEDDPIIRVADLEINEDSHDVTRAGQPVDLSPTEYKLLRYLMDNEGRVLSKAQILDHVWQYDWGGDAAIVESYISYLRKKVDGIEVDDGEGGKRKVTPLIETKRGIGYMIREPKN